MDSPAVPRIMKGLVEILLAELVDFSLNAFRCCCPIFMIPEEAAACISFWTLQDARSRSRDGRSIMGCAELLVPVR